MLQPTLFLNSPGAAAPLLGRFAGNRTPPGLSYATVRDYCESADLLPQITGRDGDLKNVQRPWAVKKVLGCIAPPARVVEIGGGEPVVSGVLSELGYDVTLVDPYDGFGNGPVDYDNYVKRFPHVRIIRAYFEPQLRDLEPASCDVILSVSVLEHIPQEPLRSCFAAIRQFLKSGGTSLHCFDFVLQGFGWEHALENARQILEQQRTIDPSLPDQEQQLDTRLSELKADVETFYLSPQGHHHWRGGQVYEAFPFRKVVSLQTAAFKPTRT